MAKRGVILLGKWWVCGKPIMKEDDNGFFFNADIAISPGLRFGCV